MHIVRYSLASPPPSLFFSFSSAMAFFTYASNSNQCPKQTLLFIFTIFTLFHTLFTTVECLSFNFSTFQPNSNNLIDFKGDAFSSRGVLQLTKNQIDDKITFSVGRASYNQPVRLWDGRTKKLTDFTTHFSFVMKAVDPKRFGEYYPAVQALVRPIHWFPPRDDFKQEYAKGKYISLLIHNSMQVVLRC